MRLKSIGILCAAALAASGIAACSDSDDSSSSGGSGTSADVPDVAVDSFTSDFSAMAELKSVADQGQGMIAVLLPDTTTSERYVNFDAPYLEKAFQTAGLSDDEYKVDNAQGSASTMQTQAEAAITAGATVLLVDAIDSGSGAAIQANAESRGVKVVDYDRLTQGGQAGRIYVSFDNVEVGKLIGQGEVDCITAWNVADPNVLVMAGDPTDNNAKLFSEGYNGVLKKHFDDGDYVKVGEPAGTWTPSEAQTTFAQQYTAHPEMNAVVTPNDDNANAVIAYLQGQGTPPKTFPTTGQDASLSGLQNILKGYQCGTVYKPIYLEAQAAATVALFLRAGLEPPDSLVNGETEDSESGDQVKSSLLTPIWVTAENMNDTVIKDGAVDASELCISALQEACTAAGITG